MECLPVSKFVCWIVFLWSKKVTTNGRFLWQTNLTFLSTYRYWLYKERRSILQLKVGHISHFVKALDRHFTSLGLPVCPPTCVSVLCLCVSACVCGAVCVCCLHDCHCVCLCVKSDRRCLLHILRDVMIEFYIQIKIKLNFLKIVPETLPLLRSKGWILKPQQSLYPFCCNLH